MVTKSYVCANCGTDCELPFEPRSDRPIYCRDCYEAGQARPQRPAIARAARPRQARPARPAVPDAVRFGMDNLSEADLNLMYSVMRAVYDWQGQRP